MELFHPFRPQATQDLILEADDPKMLAQLSGRSRTIPRSSLSGAQKLEGRLRTAIVKESDRFRESVLRSLFEELVEKYSHLVQEAKDSADEQVLSALRLIDAQELEEHPPGVLVDRIDYETWREDHSSAPLFDLVEDFVDLETDPDQVVSLTLSYALFKLDYRLLSRQTVPPLMSEVERDGKLQELLGTEEYLEDLLQDLTNSMANGILAELREQQEEDLSVYYIERLMGLYGEDAPAPRPETPEYIPNPFKGCPPMAEILASNLALKATDAIREAEGEPSDSHEGEWGKDEIGHPVRVEELATPYDGGVIFHVQAFGEPDPTAIEASMGWKMLDRMDMDTVWLHLYLLACASATYRRGDRSVMKIPRRRIEKVVFGFRHRNRTVEERARKIKRQVEALQSVFIQFQNVKRHGTKLKFKGDMTATPLWNLQMEAKGEADLFTGKKTVDWHLEAREGLWAEDFLHNLGDQWTPLPKKWFEEIDRRGERHYAQRLAVYLLFQFRINAQSGYRVKASVQTLLKVCGEDLTQARSSKKRSELKRRLSEALDTLDEDYGIRVHAEQVHMDHTWGLEYSTWKNRVAHFDPPPAMDHRLFGDAEGEPPPLPDVVGDWTPKQIRHLRTKLLEETQAELSKRLGVTKQLISQLENGRKNPSTRIQKALDVLQARFE